MEGRQLLRLQSMRQAPISVRILPRKESAGGLKLFSYLRNSSRFPSLAWQAMFSVQPGKVLAVTFEIVPCLTGD